MEEKKLRPGEVLGYAHYHWCLNKPESVQAYASPLSPYSPYRRRSFASALLSRSRIMPLTPPDSTDFLAPASFSFETVNSVSATPASTSSAKGRGASQFGSRTRYRLLCSWE